MFARRVLFDSLHFITMNKSNLKCCSPAPQGRPLARRCLKRYATLPRPQSSAAPSPTVLLDIMDTVVVDPFYTCMPAFFNMTHQELLESKHPTAWVEFERGEISEEQLFAKFFRDGRGFDGKGLVQHMRQAYQYVEGMEALLVRLVAAGVELHACSNYGVWHRVIEDKLGLERYLKWTFVSCEPPLNGLRKPSPECFAAVVSHLGVAAGDLLLVDDREANVDAAAAAGLQAVLFRDALQLERALRQQGVQL